jgi:hypothetical protein
MMDRLYTGATRKSAREGPRTKAIDRVMKAFLSTRQLSAEQTVFARSEFTKFIDELLAASTPEPPKKLLAFKRRERRSSVLIRRFACGRL